MAAASAKGLSYSHCISLYFFPWVRFLLEIFESSLFWGASVSKAVFDFSLLSGTPSDISLGFHAYFFNHGKTILSNSYFLLSRLYRHKYLRVDVAQWRGEPVYIQTNSADEGGGLGLVVLSGCGLEGAVRYHPYFPSVVRELPMSVRPPCRTWFAPGQGRANGWSGGETVAF